MIFDIKPQYLCNKHLASQHQAIHQVWNQLTGIKTMGKPLNVATMKKLCVEAARWKGKLRALYNRHQSVVLEMERRKMEHGIHSLLVRVKKDSKHQDKLLKPMSRQVAELTSMSCGCGDRMARLLKNPERPGKTMELLDKMSLILGFPYFNYAHSGCTLALIYCVPKPKGIEMLSNRFKKLASEIAGKTIASIQEDLKIFLPEHQYIYVNAAMALAHYIIRDSKMVDKKTLEKLTETFLAAMVVACVATD